MQSGSEGRIAPDETFGDAYMYVGAWVPNLSGKTGILSEEGCLLGLARSRRPRRFSSIAFA
jgi:hypothetical protein